MPLEASQRRALFRRNRTLTFEVIFAHHLQDPLGRTRLPGLALAWVSLQGVPLTPGPWPQVRTFKAAPLVRYVIRGGDIFFVSYFIVRFTFIYSCNGIY